MGWSARSGPGISWRDPPDRHGPWKTVHSRFRRYALDGVFTRALQQVQAYADAAGDIDWFVQDADQPTVTSPANSPEANYP